MKKFLSTLLALACMMTFAVVHAGQSNDLSNQKVDAGWDLYKSGDYSEAIKLLDEAIQLNPENARAYKSRGHAHLCLNQYKQAVQDFSKALKFNPNDSSTQHNRLVAANCLFKQYFEQLDRADKAIALNPNDAEAYFCRGNAHLDLGVLDFLLDDIWEDYKLAIADYDETIKLAPNHALAYHNRGICYQELGDDSKAQADFAKAKELGYKD